MLLIKIAIVITIIFILHRYITFLIPNWHVFAALMAGAFTGLWLAGFLARMNVSFETFEFFGCPPSLVKELFAVVGALVAARPISTALRQLFPYREHRDTNVR